MILLFLITFPLIFSSNSFFLIDNLSKILIPFGPNFMVFICSTTWIRTMTKTVKESCANRYTIVLFDEVSRYDLESMGSKPITLSFCAILQYICTSRRIRTLTKPGSKPSMLTITPEKQLKNPVQSD